MKIRSNIFACLFAVFLCWLSFQSLAQEPVSFDSPQQAQDYQTLIHQIRCITCPNQNIAESEGGLAQAIRADVITRLAQGDTPEAIRAALIQAYGEQIVYQPTFAQHNWALWGAPLVFCIIGLGFWWSTLRSYGEPKHEME